MPKETEGRFTIDQGDPNHPDACPPPTANYTMTHEFKLCAEDRELLERIANALEGIERHSER